LITTGNCKLKIYTSNAHKQHNPPFEIYTAQEQVTYDESPRRVESILVALNKTVWAEISAPQDLGLDPILAVHSAAHLEYIQTAYENWKSISPVEGMAFIPYKHSINREEALKGDITEADGFFMTDMTVPIGPGTFPAAYESAQIALSAAGAILQGEPSAYALCRPPGHHAGREICGGYCFLNNAAIAAQWLSQHGKIAILDIDYHAGNGTQAIFYERADVFVTSIHADPTRQYPRFCGYAHETGVGSGTGYHKNYPLPAGMDDIAYLQVLDDALDQIAKHDPVYLVVSTGMDIYADDPLGDFAITRSGIYQIGLAIARLRLPTLLVQEGGYQVDELGNNVAALLSGFMD
jgi:acetoin utilization deacetylase AcuC-like enzyme